MIFIYGLVDPQTFQIRYIGQTENLENRLRVHLSVTETNVRHKRKLTHKEAWVVSLLSANLLPLIVELDNCTEDDWEQVECWWIELCRAIKLPLTNLSNGGKGIFRGRRHTQEAIERIRKSVKERTISEETRKKISETRKGKKFSEEHLRNIGLSKSGSNNPNYGKPRSEETKRKISEANKGRFINDEWRENMSKSHLGYKQLKEVRKKMSLIGLMNSAAKQNNFEKIKLLQLEYKKLFGKYHKKYLFLCLDKI